MSNYCSKTLGLPSLIVVDSNVKDYETLAHGVVAGVEVLVLQPDQDSISQISHYLRMRPLDVMKPLAAMHLITHASPGAIHFGRETLKLDSLNWYAQQIQSWFSSFCASPSLSFYGCNLAEGSRGQRFLRALQQLTGATVHAATHLVGARSHGGQWCLDVTLPASSNEATAPFQLPFTAKVLQTYAGVFSQTQTAKLIPLDASRGDQFGSAVSLSGDIAIVGAALDNDGVSQRGSAYIFVRSANGWTQQAKLSADDPGVGDQFGFAVAVNSTTAVVGAFRDDDNGEDSGSVYVFTRLSDGRWTQQTKIVASDGAEGDRFGRVLAMNGDTLVIGAWGDDDRGENSGSVYIFTRSGNGWTQQAKLTARDGAAGDQFGRTVAISGNTVIVGALEDDDAGENSGSAYVFTRTGNTWTQQAKLIASDGTANSLFGSAVAISGNTAIVGAWGDDEKGSASGAAYIFTRSGNTWTQQTKLTASDGVARDFFGRAVAISGNTAVVSAWGDDDGGNSAGSLYVFTRLGNQWVQQPKLLAGDPQAGSLLGWEVFIDGNTIVAGANLNDAVDNDSGSVYVFDAVSGSNVLGTLQNDIIRVNFTSPGVITQTENRVGTTEIADVVNTLKGNDRVRGGDGNDILNGGGGQDRLVGNSGADVLNGGGGQDRLIGKSGNDDLLGKGGKDRLLGGDDEDTLNGGGGKDKLLGGDGKDVLNGGGGQDRLKGGSGGDLLFGGGGNDLYIGGKGKDTFVLRRGQGLDTIKDWKNGDTIGLADGLKPTQLTLLESGGDTLIWLGRQNLAVLIGVEPSDLTGSDFTRV